MLDEPTASLDPEATWEFRTLLEQLQREGKTVLLCSHLLSEVERVADRVLILVDGRRAALERLDQLKARQALATRLVIDVRERAAEAAGLLERRGIRAETPSGGSLVVEAADGRGPEALEILRNAAMEVRSFEVQRPSLEEIFLSVVKGRGGAR